jgi:hypothetical protein
MMVAAIIPTYYPPRLNRPGGWAGQNQERPVPQRLQKKPQQAQPSEDQTSFLVASGVLSYSWDGLSLIYCCKVHVGQPCAQSQTYELARMQRRIQSNRSVGYHPRREYS